VCGTMTRREYAYEQGSEKSLEVAQARGWQIVSMKNDFKNVFSFQKK
jgi:hypothetical protein